MPSGISGISPLIFGKRSSPVGAALQASETFELVMTKLKPRLLTSGF
jgi:hypothetical protein